MVTNTATVTNLNPYVPAGKVYRDRQGIMRQNTSNLWCLTCGQYFDSLYGFWRHRVVPVWPAASSPPWRAKPWPGTPPVWVTTEDDARKWGLNSDLPGWWRPGWPGWPSWPAGPVPQPPQPPGAPGGWGWGLPGWPGPNAAWRAPSATSPPQPPGGLPGPPWPKPPPGTKVPPAPPLRCLTQAEMTWWCWTTNATGGWIPPQWDTLNLQWTVTGVDFNGTAFTYSGTIPATSPPLMQQFGDIGTQVFAYLTATPGQYTGPFALTDLALQLVGPSAVSGRKVA